MPCDWTTSRPSIALSEKWLALRVASCARCAAHTSDAGAAVSRAPAAGCTACGDSASAGTCHAGTAARRLTTRTGTRAAPGRSAAAEGADGIIVDAGERASQCSADAEH